MSLLPLILMWALTKSGPQSAVPQWPTPKHPPPNKLPARKAKGTKRPSPPAPAKPATPLAPSQISPSQISPSHAPDAAPAVPAPVAPPPGLRPADTSPKPAPSAPALAATTVLNVQKLANKLGARPPLKQDGLFGPKTVGAWRALSTQRGLDPTIVRIGPKTVDVNPNTYARLNASSVVGQYDPPLYIP